MSTTSPPTEFPNFLDELEWRGLLHQCAGADNVVRAHVGTAGKVAYCGFDPTASSLTVGNYNSINLLAHWQRYGHTPIVVMGGGTGLIGDPSGKDSERRLLSESDIRDNIAGQTRIFSRLLDFDPKRPNRAIIVNNADWLCNLGYIETLRDVGKYFSVNAMIQKDSVRDRLHNREQGISYTEFSYMLMQAYDFLHLHRHNDCTLQLAGSDQYGNIVAGMDLIRRSEAQSVAYGVTSPLITRADGQKFGKSERGAIWLTADRTSPYAFYQFWVQTEDAMVLDYLRRLTHLTQAEITELSAAHEAKPQERAAHKALARFMTDALHGPEERSKVESAASLLFGGGDLAGLELGLLEDMFADVPHSEHERSTLAGDGIALTDLLADTSLARSKRQAREYVAGGAVMVNGHKVGEGYKVRDSDLLHGKIIMLRRGKRNWHALRWQ